MSHLAKRDDGEYLLPKPVIVLLIMFGAGFCVCCGYAVHSAFGIGGLNHNMNPPSEEQASYMAEVRIRSLDKVMQEGARSHYGQRRRPGEMDYSSPGPADKSW